MQQSNLQPPGPAVAEKLYRAKVCNICGSDRFRQLHFFKEWNFGDDPVKNVAIVQCRQCGVRRRMPEIVDDFEKDYHAKYVNQGKAIHPHQLYHFADLMMVRLPQFFAKEVKFLDVGCSTGRVLQLASTMGFDVTGLDFSKWAADYCASLGFRVRQGSLLGQWSESELFDVIHCSHTIEHVPDPVAYLKEMCRLLRRDGQLMLACPNYASLPRISLGDRWIWYLDSHLWQFTTKQMRDILVANGFRIVSCRTHHGLAPQRRWKRWLMNTAASMGFGDGLNIVAVRA